jgi:apolipoprotein N-acyltransferase
VKLLPMICYEDILPAFVRRLWNRGGAAEALVNITNDSWYGDTHEPLIHLVLATFRTIETRRALIRSTNTGISAFVDPAGRIVKRTGQWTKETLVDEVPLVRDGSSTLYMVVGDVLGWLGLALVALGLWRSRGRGAPAPEVQVAPAKPSPPAKSKRKSRGPRG